MPIYLRMVINPIFPEFVITIFALDYQQLDTASSWLRTVSIHCNIILSVLNIKIINVYEILGAEFANKHTYLHAVT